MIPKLKDLKYGDKNISRVLLEDKVVWSREPDHTYEIIPGRGIGMSDYLGEKIANTVKVSFSRDLRTCKRFEINQKQRFGTLTYVRVDIEEEEYPCKSSLVNGEMKFILEDFKPECEVQGDYIIWHMEIYVELTKRSGWENGSIEFDIKIKK